MNKKEFANLIKFETKERIGFKYIKMVVTEEFSGIEWFCIEWGDGLLLILIKEFAFYVYKYSHIYGRGSCLSTAFSVEELNLHLMKLYGYTC